MEEQAIILAIQKLMESGAFEKLDQPGAQSFLIYALLIVLAMLSLRFFEKDSKMKTTMYDLEYYVNVAKAVFDQQTGEELADIKAHFGQAYNEAKIVALVAVKMLARIAGLREKPVTSRGLNLVDRLVDQAMTSM